jgi:hypothetical protein
MNSDLNSDLNIVSNVILSFAQNGVLSSNPENICTKTPTVSSSMSENISEFSSATVGKRNLTPFQNLIHRLVLYLCLTKAIKIIIIHLILSL